MAAAEGAEAQAAKIRKERQDYEDAQRAYNDTLNRVSQGVANPMAMQSQYSSTGGPERAASDPWVRQNHPDLSSAAQKLVKEEGEYRAIDEPASHHAQNNCSIPAYIGKKFFEYVAQAEMIYKLATDTEFRNKVIEQLGTAAKSAFSPGGWFSDFVVSANGPPMGSLSGGAESQAAFDKAWNEYQAATNRTISRLQAVFSKMWDDFAKEWKECGLASAVTKVGIDGLFLGGEIVVGGAALRGIRFAYRLTKEGRHAVDIISVDTGKTIGSHSWSTEALEGKYGKPPENQIAGKLPDANRAVGDGPANEPRPQSADGSTNSRDADAQRRWTRKEVAGRQVYQRDELIDPNLRDANGVTNLERMQRGRAPIGSDGQEINLHHVTQDEPGPMAELSATQHSENQRLLHLYANQYDKKWRDSKGNWHRYSSAPPSMDRAPFNQWKESYWIERARDFAPLK